jgi:hypothetical protein
VSPAEVMQNQQCLIKLNLEDNYAFSRLDGSAPGDGGLR